MVIIDTSIIIDHLRQQHKTTQLMRMAQTISKHNLGLSVISIQELYEGISTRDERNEQVLLVTIGPLRIIPYSYEISQLASQLSRDAGTSIEFADAAIAATAITHGAELATLDTKHFSVVKGVDLYKLSAN